MSLAVAVFAINLLGLGLVARNGDGWDRLGAAAILAGILIEPFVDNVHLGTWRVGVASLNLTLFGAYWFISARTDRWWLVILAAVQLLAIVTHAMPLIAPMAYGQNTGVQARQALWGLVTLLLFAAAWECWAARKFALEGTDVHHDPRGV